MKFETTSNDMVVQGILKEALFHRKEFVLSDINAQDIELHLIDILEAKTREKSDKKQLIFSGKSDDFKLKIGTVYKFKTKFHQCSVEGDLLYEGLVNGLHAFKIPIALDLINQRKLKRSPVRSELKNSVVVHLKTQSWHSEGSFEPEDVSENGYGGLLWVQAGFPIDAETSIVGNFKSKATIAEINGTIQNARLLPGNRSDYDCYRIGMQQDVVVRKLQNDSRQQNRYRSKFTLKLVSCLFSDQILTLNLCDISINGFSGEVDKDSVVSNVPIGSMYEILGENTKVKLVHFFAGLYHFYIQTRNTFDGIEWLKKMTPLIYPQARCDSKDLNELYRIFFQAGAISAEYLKSHNLHQQLLISDKSDANMSRYIHRWFLHGTRDEADAYISAIRIGNTCWAIGDLVKTAGSSIKMQDSIRSFFRSFSEFAITSDSISALLAVWVKGHSYWSRWLQSLRESASEVVLSELTMSYVRCGKLSKVIHYDIEIAEVQKTDHILRAGILKELHPLQIKFLSEGFDFSDSGVGSYSYKRDCAWFDRKYILVRYKNLSYLAVLTVVIPGLSVNRFLDSLFLFPLNTSAGMSLNSIDILSISDSVSFFYKIKIPSVRILHDCGRVIGATEMTALLLLPRGFSLF